MEQPAEHFGRLGTALGRTVDAFNQTAGSYETRVLPGARRLEELGARGKKELPDAEPVDRRPRSSDFEGSRERRSEPRAPGGGLAKPSRDGLRRAQLASAEEAALSPERSAPADA